MNAVAANAPRGVGPVLLNERLGRAVVEAIRRRHPDASVVDRGAYLRVACAGVCTLAASDVEELLGASFSLPADLERIMPSFSGTLTIGDGEVTWATPKAKP
jgi:hypothetical protein